MGFAIFRSVFNDKMLLAYMKRKNIPYSIDNLGMIDVLPQRDRQPAVILTDKKHVTLQKLRTGCAIHANAARTFQANNLQLLHGSLSIKSATNFDADQLQFVEGGLEINSLDSFIHDRIEGVNGEIHANAATVFSPSALHHSQGIYTREAHTFHADALQHVDGGIFAKSAQSFKANALEIVGNFIRADSAETFEADRLRESGMLYLNNALAGTRSGNLLFSENIGSRKKISVFNANTDMIKVGCRQWTNLARMESIVGRQYRSGPHRHEYFEFFSACRTFSPQPVA